MCLESMSEIIWLDSRLNVSNAALVAWLLWVGVVALGGRVDRCKREEVGRSERCGWNIGKINTQQSTPLSTLKLQLTRSSAPAVAP